MPFSKKIEGSPFPLWIFIFIAFLVIIIFTFFIYKVFTSRSLKPPQQQTNTQEIKVAGIYQGDLPCADCPGIKETLTLESSNSAQTNGIYLLEDLYIERDPKPFQTRGVWEVINTNILKLTPLVAEAQPNYYQVLENNNLQMLDSNMQKIDSPFNSILTKQNGD